MGKGLGGLGSCNIAAAHSLAALCLGGLRRKGQRTENKDTAGYKITRENTRDPNSMCRTEDDGHGTEWCVRVWEIVVQSPTVLLLHLAFF